METKSISPFICQVIISLRLRQIRLVLAGFFLLTFGLVNFANAQTPATSDLVGRVILPPGKSATADVVILYANLKTGLPHSADSYPQYPIFPKRTQTDSQGNFKIESLDPAWLYAVLIIAPDCKFQILDRVDLAAVPLNVHLEAINPTNTAPDTVLHGRVRDADRKPVPGALIKIQEVTRKGMWNFSADNIDQFSVSDDAGNFVIYGQTAFTDAGGAIEAPGFATGLFEHWSPGDTNHELILIEGAFVQGRLLQAGKPIANAEVRLDRFGAESGSSAWNYNTLTDNQGRFSFVHLPPNRSCRLHGIMGSLANWGVVSTRLVQVHENGSTNEIGDLNLDPTFKVDGRIRLTDGKPVPTNSILYFGNFDLGMSSPYAVRNDGSFRLTGFPAGTLTLYLRIPGYELTPMDSRLISGSAINITVATNITGLVIEMKPASRK